MEPSTAASRLERAREYLAIAESGNAKREAYIRATEEIVAHREETGDTWKAIGELVGRSPSVLQAMHRWRASGYAAATPFLMDGNATGRAERSHARKILREEPELVLANLMEEAPEEVRVAFAAALLRDDSTLDRLVAEHPDAAVRTWGASAQHAAATRGPEPKPEPVDRLELLVSMRYVRRRLARVLADLQEAPSIPADVAENVRAEADWLRNAADLIQGVADGRHWDSALATLLAEEA